MQRTPAEISAVMQKVRSQDTSPERIFRKALWAKGFRYRKSSSFSLPGKPDVVLPCKNLVVFIDGDYWHGNQWRVRGLSSLEEQFASMDSKRKDYWIPKIRRTISRDVMQTQRLVAQGWKVLRFWESDLKTNLDACVDLTVKTATNGISSPEFSVLPDKTFAEFFAGIGLVRMGLEKAGWSVSFANDIDEQKERMYDGHFEDAETHFVRGDIHGLTPEQVGRVTLATASFPCNDLSLAGARNGIHKGESSAFWGFVDLLDSLDANRPPLVLLENVAGFLTSKAGEDFEDALLKLNELGYRVDAFILDAVRFVPQSRVRLFVVAVQDPHINEALPPEVVEPSTLRPKALSRFINNHPNIAWDIRNLPEPPTSSTTLKDILEDLPDDDDHWWSEERADYLLNQMSERHRTIADNMISGGTYTYGTVFRRIRNKKSMAELRTDGIAGCLRTPRGGSGRQILFKAGLGEYQARLLTARECATLMGAEEFHISEEIRLNQALFGFGDAVCVPAITWIAENYLNPVVTEMLRGVPLIRQSVI